MPDYVDQAFRAARKAEPSGKVKLFYNECTQPWRWRCPVVWVPGPGYESASLRFECGPGTFRVKVKLELGWWAIGKT